MYINAWQLKQAVQIMRKGGVIAYPTESVYGLGCDPLNGRAVIELLAIKHRPMSKGLILIAADFKQLKPYLGPVDNKTLKRIQQSWPGPMTWLLPVNPAVPNWLRGNHDTIALRITAHPLAAALCNIFGGVIVSTSANPYQQRPAKTALRVRCLFAKQLDYIVPGTIGSQKRPSEIRDAMTNKIIRPA